MVVRVSLLLSLRKYRKKRLKKTKEMKLKKANKKRETNLWLCCLRIRNQDDKLDVNRQCDWDYKIVIFA